MMASLEDIAKEVKAAAEIISTVDGLLEDASRSITIEVNNATSNTLRLRTTRLSHGALEAKALPKQIIPPFSSDVFGARSGRNAIATGTSGQVIYDIDDEATFFTLEWSVPFIGDNDRATSVDGPNAVFYVSSDIISGGNNVHARYVIGENATLALNDPNKSLSDWQTCGKCKTLFYALDEGHCAGARDMGRQAVPIAGSPFLGDFTNPVVPVNPGAIHGLINPEDLKHPPEPHLVLRFGKHEAAGHTFRLVHSVPGPNREAPWKKCAHCKVLFWDGWDKKGVCPGRQGGHIAEAGSQDFFLRFDTPVRERQQNDWRFCDKCFGLFFLPHNAQSVCPAGEQHHAHRFNYILDIA